VTLPSPTVVRALDNVGEAGASRHGELPVIAVEAHEENVGFFPAITDNEQLAARPPSAG